MNEPKCLDCEKPYDDFPMDLTMTRGQWLLIHPDDNGLLCADCILRRADKIPGVLVAHLILEVYP